jgi:hypothetical protein
MTLTTATTAARLQIPLAIVRLGDADRLGWWQSHSVDETAEYVLGHAFPDTWMATGLELAMESARIRHDTALERPTAIHIFSDYLPFHRVLRSWLLELKVERDFQPLVWLPDATTEGLRTRLGTNTDAERRAGGLYVGDARPEQLADEDALDEVLVRLAGAYAGLEGHFLAPYMDLVE